MVAQCSSANALRCAVTSVRALSLPTPSNMYAMPYASASAAQMRRTCIAGLPCGGAALRSTVTTSTRRLSHPSAATWCRSKRVSAAPTTLRSAACAASACDDTFSACAAQRLVAVAVQAGVHRVKRVC